MPAFLDIRLMLEQGTDGEIQVEPPCEAYKPQPEQVIGLESQIERFKEEVREQYF